MYRLKRCFLNTEKTSKKGFSFLELILAMGMMSVLMLTSFLLFRVILISWTDVEPYLGEKSLQQRAMQTLSKDLKESKELISSTGSNEIRFSKDSKQYYIYYLYHPSDHYSPTPSFKYSGYTLKKALLKGGLQGDFGYGEGVIVLSDLKPPPLTKITFEDQMVGVELNFEETNLDSIKTQIRPRNI